MTLHTSYRPTKFEDVIGQDHVVRPLVRTIEKKTAQSFLFCGPSGTGKTTLARIACSVVGCKGKDILEIDAATYTGIESIRQVQESLRYRPFGDSSVRAVIIDEAHALSRQAWQSLLKVIEEPPAHVYWFFCTTEAGKVPPTIKTRCASFTLKLVPDNDIAQLVTDVAIAEKIKVRDSILDLVVKKAGGSPRQALVNLGLVGGITDRAIAAKVLQTALETDATIELCRFLAKGGSWMKAMAIVGRIEAENGDSPEGIRRVVCSYMSKAIREAKSEKEACFFLTILEAFSQPYYQDDASELMLSIGKVLYAPQE